MRANVEAMKGVGEPRDRCSLGFQMGDNGRVLLIMGNPFVRSGDTIRSVNGAKLGPTGPQEYSKALRQIPFNAAVPVEVERQGEITIHQMQCSNARNFSGPLFESQEAASRKDFKTCLTKIQSAPPVFMQQWQFQYVATNCAMQVKTMAKSDEALAVYRWIDALVREAAYVEEERSAAAKAVRNSSAFFNSNARPDLGAKLESSLAAMYATAGVSTPSRPKWGKWRQTAEARIRSQLVDPASAQFEWPYGFTYGTWKPLLQKRIDGYWTCGQVNARNRMGGDTGATSFVVVMDDEKTVKFVDIGTGRDYDLTDTQCAKSVRYLPPAPPEITAAGAIAQPIMSIADELEKLAALRDKGILTQAEFEAQKEALLKKVRRTYLLATLLGSFEMAEDIHSPRKLDWTLAMRRATHLT